MHTTTCLSDINSHRLPRASSNWPKGADSSRSASFRDSTWSMWSCWRLSWWWLLLPVGEFGIPSAYYFGTYLLKKTDRKYMFSFKQLLLYIIEFIMFKIFNIDIKKKSKKEGLATNSKPPTQTASFISVEPKPYKPQCHRKVSTALMHETHRQNPHLEDAATTLDCKCIHFRSLHPFFKPGDQVFGLSYWLARKGSPHFFEGLQKKGIFLEA